MKYYKLYGKDKGKKRYNFIAVRKGKTKSSVERAFKKRSGWELTKVVPIKIKK